MKSEHGMDNDFRTVQTRMMEVQLAEVDARFAEGNKEQAEGKIGLLFI